ncbi:UNVERIFIED_CONTAM: hypothetical protein K2H54_018535 [Gekko kuhli]
MCSAEHCKGNDTKPTIGPRTCLGHSLLTGAFSPCASAYLSASDLEGVTILCGYGRQQDEVGGGRERIPRTARPPGLLMRMPWKSLARAQCTHVPVPVQPDYTERIPQVCFRPVMSGYLATQ